VEEALTARLLAAPALAALVGNRITWGWRAPGDGLPAITLTNVSPGRSYTYQGPAGLSGPRVQFDIWARDFASAKTIERALIATLEQPAELGGIRFAPAFLDAARGPIIEELGGGLIAQRVSIDVFIWFSPAA
jgi:hypothetical protein